MMKWEIKNIQNSTKLDVGIDAWSLLQNDKLEIVQINLKPGEIIEKHVNPLDVVFFVVKGYGQAIIQDQNFTLYEGDCINIDKNLQRGWENISNTELILLVYKLK